MKRPATGSSVERGPNTAAEDWAAQLDAMGPFAAARDLAAHLACAPEGADTRFLAGFVALHERPARSASAAQHLNFLSWFPA